MKKLEGLAATMTYVGDLHVGCLKGSLDYLGIDVSRPWLARVTGQTFVIAIARDICPSSVWSCWAPAYADGTMARLGRNLGYDLEYHCWYGNEPDVQDMRDQAWKRLREAIDAGHPCYGYCNFCYQLYLGYDADGFYIGEGATNAGAGPISMLDRNSMALCIVGPGGPPSDDRAAVKRGLDFAVQHARAGEEGGPHGVHSGDAYGAAAYRRWVAAMDTGQEGFTWRAIDQYVRCRELGVQFLEEAEERLSPEVTPLVREARALYRGVCDDLWPVADAFGQGKEPIPFGEPGSFHAEAADRLRSACDTEAKAIMVLERIIAAV